MRKTTRACGGIHPYIPVHCFNSLREVYMNLLSFDGSEFYIAEWPQLVGKTFSEVCYYFDGAVVVGYTRPKEDGTPTLKLNPPEKDIIKEGDGIIVLAVR